MMASAKVGDGGPWFLMVTDSLLMPIVSAMRGNVSHIGGPGTSFYKIARDNLRTYSVQRRNPPSLVVLSLGTNDMFIYSGPKYYSETLEDIRNSIHNILKTFKCHAANFLFVMPPVQHRNYRHKHMAAQVMEKLSVDIDRVHQELCRELFRSKIVYTDFSQICCNFAADGYHLSVNGCFELWSSIQRNAPNGVIDVQIDYLFAKYVSMVNFKSEIYTLLVPNSWRKEALHNRVVGSSLVSNISAEIIDQKLVNARLDIYSQSGFPYANDVNHSLSLLLPRSKSNIQNLNKKNLDFRVKQLKAARAETVHRIVRSRQFISGLDIKRTHEECVLCFLCPAVAHRASQSTVNHFNSIEHRIQMENCLAIKFCEEQQDSFTALECLGSCVKLVDTDDKKLLQTPFTQYMSISMEIDQAQLPADVKEVGLMNFGSKKSFTLTNGFYVSFEAVDDQLYCPQTFSLPMSVIIKIRNPPVVRRLMLTIDAHGSSDILGEESMTALKSSTSTELHFLVSFSIPISVNKFGANYSFVEMLAICKYRTFDQRIKTNVCQAILPVLFVAENGKLATIVDELLESPGQELELETGRSTLFGNPQVTVVQHNIRSEGDVNLPADDEVANLRMSIASVPERNYFKVISNYSNAFSRFRPPSTDVLKDIVLHELDQMEYNDALCFLAFPTPCKLDQALAALSQPVNTNNLPLHIAVSLCKELVDAHDIIPVNCNVLKIDIVDADQYDVLVMCHTTQSKDHIRRLFNADLVVKDQFTDDEHYFGMMIHKVVWDESYNPLCLTIKCMLPSGVNEIIIARSNNDDWNGFRIYESKDRKDVARSVTMVCKAAAGMMSQDERFANVTTELQFQVNDGEGEARRMLNENIKFEYRLPQKDVSVQFLGKNRRVLKQSVGKYQKLRAIHFFSRNSSENLRNFLNGLMAPPTAGSSAILAQPLCCHPDAGDYQCSCFGQDADKASLLSSYRPVEAVLLSVDSDCHTTVLHGPVGTGKTYTATNFAVEYVQNHVNDRPKVLLIAETNEAAVTIYDQLLDAAANQGFDQSSITYFVSSTEYLRKKYSLESLPHIQPVWSVREEIDIQKRSFVEREEADGPDTFRTIKDIFVQSTIIVSTRNLALRLLPRCRVLNADWNRLVVVVDEASQINLPQILFIVPYAHKLVCVGDVKQTGPYISRQKANESLPLSKCSALSFIQRCKHLQDPENAAGSIVKLYCNFRFSSSCAEFISSLWYDNDHPLVAVQNNAIVNVLDELSKLDSANILGDHFDETSHRLAVVNIEGQSTFCQNTSTVNVAAASAAVYIIHHLAQLGQQAVLNKVMKRFRLGVLSLNTAQRRLVEDYCEKDNLPEECEIEFLTIRKSQGKTFDFVVLSIEQSDYSDRITSCGYSSGFSNTRDQVLVAVSRMRYGLFLICNVHRLFADPTSTLFQLIRNTPHRALYCNDNHPSISSRPIDVIHWLLKLLLCDDNPPTKAQIEHLTAMGQLLRVSVDTLRLNVLNSRKLFTENLIKHSTMP